MNVNCDVISKSRRPHLTNNQRLPRCYKDVEKIIKSVKSCQINFKTVLAKSRLRGAHFKKVYKLSLNVLKYYNYIQKLIDKTEILKKEKFLRREIASILIYELIYGNGFLPGESKVVTIVQAYGDYIMNVHQQLQNSDDIFELNEIYIPRYVRVHTLVTTVAYVIKDLENCGFQQIFYEDTFSEEKYLQLVKNLEKGKFLVDFHFKDILVFAKDENLTGLDLYKNGHVFLQDKASYIPVHVLNPEPGSTVLDACAAPGMKSAHIASKMKNKGSLIACERDKSRFESLKETLKYGSVKIAKTLCTDFKLIDPYDEAYSAVEYILLDPSCSGSGMVNRMDDVTNNEECTTKERLMKLAGFQIILLKHALKFPSVKRVVYSTCSIHEEENEYVVHEALNAFQNSFKLVSVISECFVRGSEKYDYGTMCLRTVPVKHLTNGFFVAMFERIESYDHKDKKSKKYQLHKMSGDCIQSKKLISPCKKGNSETNIKQEKKSYKGKELNKTTKDYLLNNNDRHEEKLFDSNNNKNCDVENMIHNSYHLEKSEKLKNPEFTKYKKNKELAVDSQLQFNKQCQDEWPNNGSSDLLRECKSVGILKSSSSPKVGLTVDIVLEEKKSKHKRPYCSENNFDVAERNCEIFAENDLKSKKKKRGHAEKKSSCNIVSQMVQNDVPNSTMCEMLQNAAKSSENLHKNDESMTHSIYTEESIDLGTSQRKKHKKKKKEKEHAVDVNSNEWNQEEVLNATHSDFAQKSEHSNTMVNLTTELCKRVEKKSKPKMRCSSDSEPEITEKNCEMYVSGKSKHKKKKRKHSIEENTSIITPAQVTEVEGNKDSFIKHTKKKKINDSVLNNIQSESSENKNSCEAVSVKFTDKKQKKHKNSSDFTFNKLNNLLVCDLPEVHFEGISESSPRESNFLVNEKDKKRTSKKKKKDKEYNSLNLHDIDTSVPNINSVQESSNKLLSSEMEPVVDCVHNDFPKRRKSKKHKLHVKDEACCSKDADSLVYVKDKNILSPKLNYLASQLEEKLEYILLNDSEAK